MHFSFDSSAAAKQWSVGFLFAWLPLSVPALGQPSLHDYAALPAIQLMSVSPDGGQVAFRMRKAESDVVVVVGIQERKVLTGLDVSAIMPSQLYFLDQSRVIMVAADEDFMRGYRGHLRRTTAYSLDIGTGQYAQLLTPGDKIIIGQTGIGDIVGASPDGTHVYMPAFTGDENNQPDLSLMDVDLNSVRRPKRLMKGSNHTIDYFVDERGSVLAREIFNDRTNVHSIVAYHGDDSLEIYRHETDLRSIIPSALTHDRKSLIFSSRSGGRRSYYSMSLDDGTISPPVFQRDDADVEAILMDINRIAYGVIYSGLSPSYEFFDERLTKSLQEIQAGFPDDSVWIRDVSPDLNHLVLLVEGSGSSGNFYLHSDGGKPQFLAAARPTINAEFVNPVVAYEYAARDGAMIPSLITIPVDRVDDPNGLPAVMFPHGGPESHDWLGFDWFAQALASQGYIVIQPQFRGSSGFGNEHMLAGRGEWGKKSQDDITDALRHAIADGLVDEERVCIAGMSYGGFAALAGGAFTPELYQCVVSINGVSDVRVMLQQEKRDHGGHHSALSYWNEVIAKGDTSKATLDSISPANYAENFTAPVLLVHGTKDNVVDYSQSSIMQKQLKRAGKSVSLVKLKGEDHHLSTPETRLQCLEAAVNFINENLGDGS
jgi:dipeptidyl aminopeptidase/acylaminoacyl peptidase